MAKSIGRHPKERRSRRGKCSIYTIAVLCVTTLLIASVVWIMGSIPYDLASIQYDDLEPHLDFGGGILEVLIEEEEPEVAIDDDVSDYEATTDDEEAITKIEEKTKVKEPTKTKVTPKVEEQSKGKEPPKIKEATTKIEKITKVKEKTKAKEPAKIEKLEEPPKPHPFAGARDPDGKWGYVADVTSVRKRHLESYSMTENYKLSPNSPHYKYVCEKPAGEAWEGKDGLKLMQKVQIGGPTPTNSTNNADVTSPKSNIDESVEKKEVKKPKVLCAIYTYDKNHPRIESVAASWAWKCDGFFAASTLTNETIGTVDLPHKGPESDQNMWQKTRSIWAYIHDNYVDDYDYFWLGGDDYFLIVENLVNMLASIHATKGPEEPLYLGSQVPMVGGYYCGGGAGYVLNKVAVKRLITEALPTCNKNIIKPAEDRYLGYCFRELGVYCEPDTDAKGQQRFVAMDPQYMAITRGDKDFFEELYTFWGERSGGFKWGIDLISEQSIGFHNLRYPAFMERIYAVLFPEACPSNSTLAKGMALLKESEDESIGEDKEEEVDEEEEVEIVEEGEEENVDSLGNLYQTWY